MFYVYIIPNTDFFIAFTGIRKFKVIKTKEIEKAFCWTSEKYAKSWESTIKAKFPTAELKKATLKVIED